TRSAGCRLATTTNAAVGEVVTAPPHACHTSRTRPRGPHFSAATRRVAPPKRAAHGGAPPGRACSSRRDERGDAVECSVDHIVGVVLVRDRKSTRLNSSHVSSSYAVLCLKKNKPRSRLV